MTTTSLPANPFAPDAQAGKVAVVTGASSGIGRATAELMAATGWTVYAVARRAERLEELASRTSVRPVVLDITDADAVAARAQEILGKPAAVLTPWSIFPAVLLGLTLWLTLTPLAGRPCLSST